MPKDVSRPRSELREGLQPLVSLAVSSGNNRSRDLRYRHRFNCVHARQGGHSAGGHAAFERDSRRRAAPSDYRAGIGSPAARGESAIEIARKEVAL